MSSQALCLCLDYMVRNRHPVSSTRCEVFGAPDDELKEPAGDQDCCISGI
jgi:hypothetical protein